MNKIKLYKNIGLVIWIIATIILLYLVFKPDESKTDTSFLKEHIEVLEKEKKEFQRNVAIRDSINAIDKKKASILTSQRDSLLILISKAPAKYVEKNRQIDNATSGFIINEFKTIFSENNVR